MRAGQKLVASDGKQVLLFPLEYLYMSQDEGGDYSHAGTLAMDFLGWGSNGRILHCPYYAPCDAICIASTEEANRIWQSTTEVHLADGTLSYVTWVQAHDNNPFPVGTFKSQGEICGHTGTAGNVTGDHVHFNFSKGTYQGWEQVGPNNNWQLKNSIHIYNACYVNDTNIIEGYNHPWENYEGPIVPPGKRKKRKNFKWVLYANKLRLRNR